MSIKTASYSVIGFGALATLILSNVIAYPVNLTAIGFAVWGVSPYIYLAYMTKSAKTKAAAITVLLLSLLVALFGVGLIVDATIIQSDANGALVFIFAPLWQWVFLLVASLPLYFLNRLKTV